MLPVNVIVVSTISEKNFMPSSIYNAFKCFLSTKTAHWHHTSY